MQHRIHVDCDTCSVQSNAKLFERNTEKANKMANRDRRTHFYVSRWKSHRRQYKLYPYGCAVCRVYTLVHSFFFFFFLLFTVRFCLNFISLFESKSLCVFECYISGAMLNICMCVDFSCEL